jgi:LPS sulfotransferase NodH
MLAGLLAGSGSVGLAAEHFNPHTVPRDVHVGDYLAACSTKALGTGVFGTKLHWDQLGPLLRLLRGLRRTRGLADGELLDAVFPEARYLWIRREDIVAQGVSWWRAKQTRVWLDDDRALADPVFDFDAIDERVRMAQEQTGAWQEWFDANRIGAFPVVYEQLVANPAAVTAEALRFLGKDGTSLAVESRTRRQADELSDEWIRRYRQLAEAR